MKWLAEAVLMAAVALLKSIPVVGAAPWACALVDALFLFVLLLAARAGHRRAVFFAAALMPMLDWAQGAIPGLWVVFAALGFYAAAHAWGRMDARPVTRAVLSLLSAYVLRMFGVAVGYILLKDMGLWTALSAVVRNGWFIFLWYAAAVAAAALAEKYPLKRKKERLAETLFFSLVTVLWKNRSCRCTARRCR